MGQSKFTGEEMKAVGVLAITVIVLCLGPVNGQRPRPKNLNPLDWVLWYIEIDFNRDGFITPDEVIVHCTRVLSNPIAKKVAAALFGTGAGRRRREAQPSLDDRFIPLGPLGGNGGLFGGQGKGGTGGFGSGFGGFGGFGGGRRGRGGCDQNGDGKISQYEILFGCGIMKFIGIFTKFYG